jgi:hypothetical protein
MNKLVLFIPLFLLLLPTQAFATQFIPYTGTVQPSTPIICVIDNSGGSDGIPMTQRAINAWSDKLNHLTHSHNWNMTVILIDKTHMTDCNIVFNYTLKPSDPQSFKSQITGKPESGRILGITSCDNTQYGHTYCEISIYLLNNNPSTLYTTIQHEFGHAIGIGHRQGDNAPDSMRAFLSDDLMFGSTKKFQHLTNEDALAIINMYGTHGFGLVNPPHQPYIINYHTHFPCKFGNSTTINTCTV